MRLVCLSLLLCIINICHRISEAVLPEVIRKCPRSVENINECICESIELLRTNLANGDFGDNFTIPKIEPLFIDEIEVHRGNDFKASFKNLVVSGPSQFVLKHMRANIENKTFSFELELPFLEFIGDYSIALKLLVKLSGNGKFKGAFKNSLAKVSAVGKPSAREGFTEFFLNVQLNVDYASFQMESLLLSNLGNKLINDNYKMFLDELVPGLEASLSRIFTDIVNNILKDSTYEEMFPE